MREAIGHSILTQLILVFLVVALLILIGSLSYSKAFKAKNRIISIIEDNKGFDSEIEGKIDQMLRDSAYPSISGYKHNSQSDCPDVGGTYKGGMTNYPYCVYEKETNRGVYYTVVIYMRFEFPLISGLVEIPVHGDTRTIYDNRIEG